MEEKELTNDVDTNTDVQTTETHVQETPKTESTKEDNIRKLREDKENAELKVKQYQMELMRFQQQQQAPKKRELKPDDVAEGQDIYEVRRELQELKVYSARPDMDTLVTSDMGSLIDKKYPRMAQLLASIEDPLMKKAAVYDFIKEMKLDDQQDQSQKMDKVIKESEAKTKTIGSAREVANNPLDQAHRYTDKGLSLDEKQRLRAETSKFAKY